MSTRPMPHVNGLAQYQNLAITQSHEYYVNFNPIGFPAGTIQIQYQPPLVGE